VVCKNQLEVPVERYPGFWQYALNEGFSFLAGFGKEDNRWVMGS